MNKRMQLYIKNFTETPDNPMNQKVRMPFTLLQNNKQGRSWARFQPDKAKLVARLFKIANHE